MNALRGVVDSVVARLVAVGADPADDEEMRLRKALLVLISVAILPVSLAWSVIYLALGSVVGWVPLLYFVISVVALLVFARTRNADWLLKVELTDILLAPTLSMIPLGGFVGASAVGLWGILAPMGALVFGGVRSGIRWFVAFAVVFLGSGIAGEIWGPADSGLPDWFTTMMLALNVVFAGIIVFTLLAIFAQQRSDAVAALRVEQDKAESLLLNILPRSIAEKLKGEPQTIADQFSAASILFADVVDFTPLSEGLAPAEVVGLLDKLFSRFDDLADKYGVEKIKTIGDSYMVAAGVPTPRPDHARALALMALDMLDVMQSDDEFAKRGMELRIGLNSGPVVAGVIGRKRFLYDLWGDAVNTASRMETHGTPSRIQITGATYELLKDDFECVPRGTVVIKGKGDMETWYLLGPRTRSAGLTVEPASAALPSELIRQT